VHVSDGHLEVAVIIDEAISPARKILDDGFCCACTLDILWEVTSASVSVCIVSVPRVAEGRQRVGWNMLGKGTVHSNVSWSMETLIALIETGK